MFSLFNKGIADCNPARKISIEALVKLIKTNDTPTIQSIRALDQNAPGYDVAKKKLKQKLAYITPNCTVSYRDDDHITEFSGYMYFDIDHIEDPTEYKDKLIQDYKGYISMVCLSCSGTGLSIFTKIEDEITLLNFKSIREYICQHGFKDLNLDPKTTIKTNAWFISYDPDCYFDPSSVIEIPENNIRNEDQEKKKGASHNIYNPPIDSLRSAPLHYQSIPISEVYRTLRFRTDVEITNKIFDMRTVEYCEVYIPKDYRIKGGDKTRFFRQIIHNLVYLNPDADPDYILSYLIYLNYNKTVTGSAGLLADVERLFIQVYNGIKNNGILKPKFTTKTFHCKPNTICREDKLALSSRMTGIHRKYKSIKAIRDARAILEIQRMEGASHKESINELYILSSAPFVKVTQKDVCEFIKKFADDNDLKGIGIRTIKRYWRTAPFDLDAFVKAENDKIQITYIPKE
jgi:hypothetical protein